MDLFPIQKFKPLHAKISGVNGDVSIEIFFKLFELNLEDYSEVFDSSIRLDGIDIPIGPNELQNKSYGFPVNPEDGYIDGSIYFFSSHNPVDVTQLEFGKIAENKLPIKLCTEWVLEFENTRLMVKLLMIQCDTIHYSIKYQQK